MEFFKKIGQLMSPKPAPAAVFPTLEYKGFTITPQPMKDNGQFRVAAMIEKGEGDTLQQHHFIRSDCQVSAEETAKLTLLKCKIFIDQIGAKMFD
ncbi:MAG: hypothetical protein ACJAU1_000078 [Psychromonas sp.]|jgi:hypothetical protein